MVEELIINLFCSDRAYYEKYYRYVNLNYIKINFVNLYKIFLVVANFYKKNNNNSLNKVELELSYHTNYLLEHSERDELSSTLDRILATDISTPEQVTDYLEEHRKRCLSGEIAKLALDVEDGSAKIEVLLDKFQEFEHQKVNSTKAIPVNMDIASLYNSQIAQPGLRWRLDWLNKSLGSLRKGDFGFIFARPETGKTTFLASEMTHMVTQTTGDIIWFNNEEQGDKVGIRCLQALFGIHHKEVFADIENKTAEYTKVVGNRIRIYDDLDDSTIASRIEDILKETNPALIIFDQIDKIKGFKADRHDLELKKIYQWAREIAKKYAPVIAVSQAGGTAEDKLWLTMNDVDSSKTAKQGEADWILGIGQAVDNSSNLRFLNISKNKLLGDDDSLPDLRHGNAQVMIKPEIARYEEL